MAQHNLFGVEINQTMLGGTGTQTSDVASDVRNESAAGNPYNEIAALAGQRPRATFSTRSVSDAFDAVPISGVYVGGGGGNSCRLFAQKRAQGGTREAGAAHRAYEVLEGAVILRTLDVDHQGDAVVNLEVLVGWDGTANEPFQVSDDVSLPTLPRSDAIFGLGPTTIAGVSLDGKRNLSIDFGITETVEGADSDIWPTEVSLSTILPVISLRGIDVSWYGSGKIDSLRGKEATNADTAIYLRRRKLDGTWYGNLETEHVKIAAQGLVTVSRAFDASGPEPGESGIVLTTQHDGTNLPVTITTGVALP